MRIRARAGIAHIPLLPRSRKTRRRDRRSSAAGMLSSICLLAISASAMSWAAPWVSSARAEAKIDCATETRALQILATAIEISVDVPKDLVSGGAIQVTWNARQRMPAASGIHAIVAIPGDVRFVAAPLQASPAGDGGGEPRPADLPGFMALPPAAAGPMGLGFGSGKSRAVLPLYQPGAKLGGSFGVRIFDAGAIEVETAVVAVNRCGERIVGGASRRTVTVAPGKPEIVVQDPYDIERPQKVILSATGRYRANVLADRYRVYDVETGAMLIDRAGHDVAFSPTSRFLATTVGDESSTVHEVIDLASREVIARPSGVFLGWTRGDAWLVIGHGSWGRLSVRPTLITRLAPAAAASIGDQADADSTGIDDGLELNHTGSCHACASWTDDNMMLDPDNGIVAFSGSFEPEKERVHELASGATPCCGRAGQIAPFVARSYPLAPFRMAKGWEARDPIRFTHIYDAAADPQAKQLAGNPWFEAAKPMRRLRLEQKVAEAGAAPVEVAGLSGAAVVRGDWRTHVARSAEPATASPRTRRITTELARLGFTTAAPLKREDIGFVNSWAGGDRRAGGGLSATAADYDRTDAKIEARTKPVEQRLVREVPAIAAHLGRHAASRDGPYQRPMPLDGLGTGKIDLTTTLEGLWRWEVAGRPIWLMQLWATEGNAGFGEGMLLLLEGAAGGGGGGKGRVVDLTGPLQAFWSGAYGWSDHQTQVKPAIFLDRYLVAASVAQKTIAVVDLAEMRTLAVMTDVPSADLMSEVILSADARHVLQTGADGQLFIHELATGKVAVGGRSVDDEIIAYTPEGYYWSSYEGAHFVQLRFPGLPGLYPFQQFAAVLERPDILKARLKPGAAAEPAGSVAQAPRLSPPPRLAVSRVKAAGGGGAPRLRVEARSELGLARLRLYADGRLLQELPLAGAETTVEITAPDAPGARWLTLQASDTAGFVSIPEALRLEPAAKAGRLHALLVGIDEYRDKRLRLDYARSDAERLAGALRASAGSYYAEADVRVLAGTKAGKAAILAALEDAVASTRAGDTVVFSFAGHGDQDKASGRYFLTPSDFDRADIAGSGLAWAEIARVLEQAKARVVVILDACHSGLSGAEQAGSEQAGTNDDAVEAILARRQAPMLVLAASKGRQVSYEHERWGGGLFTYALVEALEKQRAAHDTDRDGVIEASELYRAVKGIVATGSRGLQTPWLARRDLIGDFALF